MTTSERFPTPRATDADKGGRGELLSVVRTGHPRAPSTMDQLTLFAEDSLARTSPPRDVEKASKVPARDYGASTPVLLARYDPDTSLWRTSQHSLEGGLTEFSETFPRSGMMLSGTAYRLPPLVRLTAGTGSGLWATPVSQPAGGTPEQFLERKRKSVTKGNSMGISLTDLSLQVQVAERMWPTPTVGGGGETLPEGTTPTGQTPDGRKQTVCLERYVKQVERGMWPTPRSADGMVNNLKFPPREARGRLEDAVANSVWPTPTATMHKGSSPKAMTRASGASRRNDRLDFAVEQGSGALNPEWVEALMGFPIGYTDIAGED